MLEAWARCSWTHTFLQPVKPNNTKTQTQSEIKSYESMLRELNQDQHYVLLTTHVHQDFNLLCINNQLETSNDYSTVPTVALLSFNKIKLISFKVFKSKGLEAMSPQPWNVYHMQRAHRPPKSKFLLKIQSKAWYNFYRVTLPQKFHINRAQRASIYAKREG